LHAPSLKEKLVNRYRFAITALAAMLLAGPTFAVDITPASSTSTRLSVTGFIQAYGTYYANASQGETSSIGLDNRTAPNQQFVDTIRTSRLAFNTITPNPELGDITTCFEFDLAPMWSQATNFHIRQAYGTWGNFTLGQTWSNWVDGDAAADEVDWFGPVGQAGYDNPRLPLAAYKWQLNKENSVILSVEEHAGIYPGANDGANWAIPGAPAAPSTATGPSSLQNDSKVPNLVGVYQYYDKWGHIAVRALAQNYGLYSLPGATGSPVRPSKWGTAIQVSGQLNCFGLDVERDSLIYNVYTGSALGEYGYGLQSAQYNATTQTISLYKNTGWTVGYTHTWDAKVRSNLVLSGVNFSTGGSIVTQTGDIKSQNDVQVNTFVKMTKTAELGVEYMYETVKTVNANDVLNNNGTTGNKNNSSKVELEVKFTF
jgi:hypothetical protein